MPSGAYVTVRHSTWSKKLNLYYMNIIVYPVKEDFNISSGLCGNYNGNPADDLIPAGQTVVDDSGGSVNPIPHFFPSSYR